MCCEKDAKQCDAFSFFCSVDFYFLWPSLCNFSSALKVRLIINLQCPPQWPEIKHSMFQYVWPYARALPKWLLLTQNWCALKRDKNLVFSKLFFPKLVFSKLKDELFLPENCQFAP